MTAYEKVKCDFMSDLNALNIAESNDYLNQCKFCHQLCKNCFDLVLFVADQVSGFILYRTVSASVSFLHRVMVIRKHSLPMGPRSGSLK